MSHLDAPQIETVETSKFNYKNSKSIEDTRAVMQEGLKMFRQAKRDNAKRFGTLVNNTAHDKFIQVFQPGKDV